MSSLIEVSQVMGPMWSIAGRAIVVPSVESVPLFVLGAVFASVDGVGPWRVRLAAGGQVHDLLLGLDGSVTLAGPETPTISGRSSGFLKWSRRGAE